MNKYIMTKKRLTSYFLDMDDVRKSDYVLLGGLIFICCVFFNQHYDLSITIEHSITMIESILEGRPHHFYGIVYENAIAGNYLGDASALHSANYTFLVYLILAVINFPLYIIEKIGQFSFDKYIYIQWAKIFIVLATFITGQVMKKIGLKLGMSHKRSNWLAFAFVSSPILLFGSMAFGQTDIFSTLFLVLAMLMYFKKDYYKFCAFMAVAIELKLFAMLAFVVLIFLVEKRLVQIVKYLLTGLSILLVETFIFSFSDGKQLTSEFMAATYNFKNRLFATGMNGFYFVSFIMVGFVFVIVLAYMKEIKTEEEHNMYGILFPLAMYTVLLGFIDWHPQWVCVIVPFITLATYSFFKIKTSLYIEIVLGASYIIMSSLWYTNNVDADMINQGILPILTGFKLPVSDVSFQTLLFVVKTGLPIAFYSSILFGGLMMNLFTKVPLVNQKKFVPADDANEPVSRSFMWCRMLTILIFIVPTFVYYFHEWFEVL